MNKKTKDLHEKIADVQNVMWAAYKEFLKAYDAHPINDAAKRLEEKYKTDDMVMQFVWYEKAKWAMVVSVIREMM
ncbi:hypothetical protein OCV51_13035 [Faecalicatena acetigenes]|uniref:Uncharacterized protein n=1 Tax=Faecalicatena acetigenes TaxID=2981790 RepID=A0ABT2TEY3_9FIRM|nr:hypothetical protein [Faecalicatena acetigenes]MCU6748566.1 hypothetical protein [Faecalicatena acetigenes]SCI51376.1 Uncharacterised protein [uncultured Clostridium sp.]